MMWRVPWATATGGHTDQIVEMLDVYPCADPSQAPSALDGEGSTIFGGSKGRAIVLPGRSSSSRVSRRCLRATAWTPSRRLTASTASPMPRPSGSAAHRSATSPSCSGPVSSHQARQQNVLASLPNPCMCSQTETTRARSRRRRRRRWLAGGRWPTRCGIAAGAVRISAPPPPSIYATSSRMGDKFDDLRSAVVLLFVGRHCEHEI